MTPNTVVIHTSSVRVHHFEEALKEIARPASADTTTRRRGAAVSKWKRFTDTDLEDYAFIGISVGSTEAYAAGIVEVGPGVARLIVGDYDAVSHAAIVNEFLGIMSHRSDINTVVIGDAEYLIERIEDVGSDTMCLFDATVKRVSNRAPVTAVSHKDIESARDAYKTAISSPAFQLIINGID